MIRWCCYCQRLLREKPPLTSFEITHAICDRCETRLLNDEPLIAEYDTVIRFYRELFSAATLGDRRVCAEMARSACALGYSPVEILVGLVQPLLVEIGARWECGLVTVADEHRVTSWCETMINTLELPTTPAGPIDILIVQAHGNSHMVGPHMAERIFLTNDVSAMTVMTEIDPGRLLQLTREREVGWIGFSCALPHMVGESLDLASHLKTKGYTGGVILSGQAVRRTPDAWRELNATVCPTIEEARDVILAAAGRPPRTTLRP